MTSIFSCKKAVFITIILLTNITAHTQIQININTSENVSTSNPPVLIVSFAKDFPQKSILYKVVSEDVEYSPWGITIQNEDGKRYEIVSDWSGISVDDLDFQDDKAVNKTYIERQRLSKIFNVFEAITKNQYGWSKFYGLPLGKYKVQLKYIIPNKISKKLKESFKDRTFNRIQTYTDSLVSNWLDFEVFPSDIHLVSDYSDLELIPSSGYNRHIYSKFKQVSVVKNGKYVVEQIYNKKNRLVAEFKPNEPQSKLTKLKFKGEDYLFLAEDSLDGVFQVYDYYKIATKGQLKKGQLDGLITKKEHKNFFYGSVITAMKFANGELMSESSFSYMFGKNSFVANYKNGLLHGEYVRILENGAEWKMTYKDGLVDGKVEMYDKHGTLRLVEHYLPKGKKAVITAKIRNVLIGRNYFKYQVKHGEFQNFSENGDLINKFNYKNDLRVGKHIRFAYSERQRKTFKSVGYYKEGKPWKGTFTVPDLEDNREYFESWQSGRFLQISFKKGVETKRVEIN
ncbi:MAG: toxin-antitoxin system YwqK family antitoxin [Saprospiraceae bacterium]